MAQVIHRADFQITLHDPIGQIGELFLALIVGRHFRAPYPVVGRGKV